MLPNGLTTFLQIYQQASVVILPLAGVQGEIFSETFRLSTLGVLSLIDVLKYKDY